MQIISVSFKINQGPIKNTVIQAQSGSRQATWNDAILTLAEIHNVKPAQIEIVTLT